MKISALVARFAVCKVVDFSGVDWSAPYCFIAQTDEENSLVCESSRVPANVLACEDGWRGFRVQDPLDFSLVGVLARLTAILAEAKIGIFAVSTYNTDYVFVKEADFVRALATLADNGYDEIL